MKKGLLLFGSVMVTLLTFAQIKAPVQWSFSSKKIDGATYEVYLTAKIEEDWHIYSQSTPEGGPVPTSISFSKNPLATPIGTIKEIGKLEKHFEQLFGVEVKQFSDKVEFVQRIAVKPGIKTAITGTVTFMVCNDHECLPPTKREFTIALN